MPEEPTICCTVAHDSDQGLRLQVHRIPAGTSAGELLEGLAIDWLPGRVGIFGQLCERNHRLEDGDRLEIYRELLHDPKEARRRRADDSARKQRSLRRRVR